MWKLLFFTVALLFVCTSCNRFNQKGRAVIDNPMYVHTITSVAEAIAEGDIFSFFSVRNFTEVRRMYRDILGWNNKEFKDFFHEAVDFFKNDFGMEFNFDFDQVPIGTGPNGIVDIFFARPHVLLYRPLFWQGVPQCALKRALQLDVGYLATVTKEFVFKGIRFPVGQQLAFGFYKFVGIRKSCDDNDFDDDDSEHRKCDKNHQDDAEKRNCDKCHHDNDDDDDHHHKDKFLGPFYSFYNTEPRSIGDPPLTFACATTMGGFGQGIIRGRQFVDVLPDGRSRFTINSVHSFPVHITSP